MTWSYVASCNCDACRLERLERRANHSTSTTVADLLPRDGVVARWGGQDVPQPPMHHLATPQTPVSPIAASIEPPALDEWTYAPRPILATCRMSKPEAGEHLPTDAAARKALPVATGVLDYFPDALAAVAHASKVGNDQHSPGQPLHWAKEKSTDEADCLIRHFLERGTTDTDGVKHSAKVAWRALALLQREIEVERRMAAFEATGRDPISGNKVTFTID